MTPRRLPPVLLISCALSACVAAEGPAPVSTVATTEAGSADTLRRSAVSPEAGPDACWARDDAPADRARAPAADGSVAAWFRIPCGAEEDPEFIASVQRALAARGIYGGPATGEVDDATRTAIIAYQRTLGLRSGVLSLAAARSLGLVIWEPGASLWQ